MKIFICCSKYHYYIVDSVKNELENLGHEITLPNSFEEPMKEEEIKKIGYEKHSKWKNTMLLLQTKKVNENDALLVLNYEKNDLSNYIGGATFLEIFQAFQQNKKIFLMNPIPEGILKDELIGMNPIIINQNLNLIK